MSVSLYDVLEAYCDVLKRQHIKATDNRQHIKAMDKAYRLARIEHAFLLRAEGLRYKDIGKRLGVCTQRAQQLARFFSSRMRFAMRHTKVYSA